MEFLQFIFSNAWVYFGFAILLGIVLNFLQKLWQDFLAHRNIVKNGYPPKHCNASGEIIDDNNINTGFST